MRKIYIFLTEDIRLMGGIQRYTLSKANYLKKQGYEVYAFFDGYSYGHCKFTELNTYIKDEIPGLRILPYEYSSFLIFFIVRRIIKRIGNISNAEIIIESQNHTMAMWGELLASKIGAKHMCFLCNELFYGPEKHYEDRLDFYYFKYKRKELYGISDSSITNLLGDYFKTDDGDKYRFCAAMDSPVMEVDCEKLNIMGEAEWSIGYIGRADKLYVPEIVKGVVEFAETFPDKKIQFVIVGDVGNYSNNFDLLSCCHNIVQVRMGDLTPIPLKLFKKLDVVIAGAGCAYYSAISGALTIVADANNCRANGVLGYDTTDYIFAKNGAEQTDFATAIKRVLIEKRYIDRKFNLQTEELDSTDIHFDKQLMDSKNEYETEYFDNYRLLEKVTNKRITVRKIANAFCPLGILFIRRVKAVI